MGIINEEQVKVVKKLEEVLSILKHVEIKTTESLIFIKKPLDDLLSSLKYLPTDPPISSLPTEIKSDILGYLCDSGTLIASSVCHEWKQILDPQVNNMTEVKMGKHCSNEYECEEVKCRSPEGILSALGTLKLDNIKLSICHPLTQVDTHLVTEGLTNVSSVTIIRDCKDCVGFMITNHDDLQIFTQEQKEQLSIDVLYSTSNKDEIYCEKKIFKSHKKIVCF